MKPSEAVEEVYKEAISGQVGTRLVDSVKKVMLKAAKAHPKKMRASAAKAAIDFLQEKGKSNPVLGRRLNKIAGISKEGSEKSKPSKVIEGSSKDATSDEGDDNLEELKSKVVKKVAVALIKPAEMDKASLRAVLKKHGIPYAKEDKEDALRKKLTEVLQRVSLRVIPDYNKIDLKVLRKDDKEGDCFGVLLDLEDEACQICPVTVECKTKLKANLNDPTWLKLAVGEEAAKKATTDEAEEEEAEEEENEDEKPAKSKGKKAAASDDEEDADEDEEEEEESEDAEEEESAEDDEEEEDEDGEEDGDDEADEADEADDEEEESEEEDEAEEKSSKSKSKDKKKAESDDDDDDEEAEEEEDGDDDEEEEKEDDEDEEIEEGPNKRNRAKLEYDADRKFKVVGSKNPFGKKDDAYDLIQKLLKSTGKVLTFGKLKEMIEEEFDIENEKDLVKNTLSVIRELESSDPRIVKVLGV